MTTEEIRVLFRRLVENIEIDARAIREGKALDIPFKLGRIRHDVDAAIAIAAEVSREALDDLDGSRS